jgi:hypothetical protein
VGLLAWVQTLTEPQEGELPQLPLIVVQQEEEQRY